IEIELARLLVVEKVHISTVDSQLNIETFPYHMELFHENHHLGDGEILIEGYVNQWINLSNLFTNESFNNNLTSVGDGEILIEEYVNQWINLSNLFTNESFNNNLLKIGLKLCPELFQSLDYALFSTNFQNHYWLKIFIMRINIQSGEQIN
ncbi:16128_t:CDS:2, partial [Gigaspora rosea]